MYTVDERDKVVEWDFPPQSSPGSPCPELVASEHQLALAYYLDDLDTQRYGEPAEVDGAEHGDLVAVLRFERAPHAYYHGAPNDEAFSGHPLDARGLGPYGSYEIEDSSWARLLEKMNSVHDAHDPARFMEEIHHRVMSFHDTTFEWVGWYDPVVLVYRGSVRAALLDVFRTFRD